MAFVKDAIRGDMQEVAEEISSSAEAESLVMTTELAKREARITQLGSRIEDLQVQSNNAFWGQPLRMVSHSSFFLTKSGEWWRAVKMPDGLYSHSKARRPNPFVDNNIGHGCVVLAFLFDD